MVREPKEPQCQVHDCRHMSDAAEQAADHAVRKVFAILGVDINKPESIEEFREDLRFGKKLRRMSDHGQLAIVAALVLAVLWAIWEGVRAKVGA